MLKKTRSKTCFDDPIKNCAKLTANILTAVYKSKVTNFKLDEDTQQRQVYLQSFMNSLKFVLSQFKETYMLLIYYASISGEYWPYYSKN